ncbi:CaiB/BaiF CoA transferase family protein [Desertibaculum subflavum]|uniref:CaiB/BaiF CoA transferase family protein n=1 Tax=Desertibaculum subflavum TaxID=2268458 RepID=UPI000E66DAD9
MKPSSVAGPLNGVTVLDLTRVLAGPYCAMVLADLGARVIKIEVPGTGDDSRQVGPFINGKSAYFMSINRGKESIALDLKAPADRAIFERLLARADVLLENYRGGTMEKLNYGFDVLHQRFPQLIYAACSGFGHSGPYKTRAAYDMVVQGMGGVMSLTGHSGGPPTRVGTSIGDLAAGLFTAIGINAALFERRATGQGRKIDVSMLDSQVAFLENAIARYAATGEVPGPLGARHSTITPFAAFSTKDGHIIIAAGNDGLFAALAKALGHPEWTTDPRFRTNPDRTAHHAELTAAMEAVLLTNITAHWLSVLDKASVPCGPINNVAQVLADPQVMSRNMVASAEDPVAGRITMAGNPIKLSGVPDPVERPYAPGLDEHRAAILAELDMLDRE